MRKCKLSEVADIVISNVDKKSFDNEFDVILCNFTDVYYNWAITSEYSSKLMNATATKDEINKYSLQKGDVAITKDSETKDDIGQSTYIADDVSNMLLGYHCALIRPNADKLLGAYLNALLHTKLATRYFELNASGSGQRYTLSVDAIKDFQINLPPLNIQRKICKILSDIDKKIENNNRINDNLSAMAKTIYDYWFTQFDFPDEDGKPYRSSGGKMVWNEQLKREIPENWSVSSLGDISKIKCDTIHPIEDVLYSHYSIPAYDNGQIPIQQLGNEILSNKYSVIPNSVLVSKLNPKFQRVWFVDKCETNSICSTEFIQFISKSVPITFLYSLLSSDQFNQFMIQCSSSSTGSRKRIDPSICLSFEVATPTNWDILCKFDKMCMPIMLDIEKNLKEVKAISEFRDWLLPMLMNGQATIAD